MPKTITPQNRRFFPRFKPQGDNMYVLDSTFGKVINIGMGGMLFTYSPDKIHPESLASDCIAFGCCGHFLEKIPFKTVSDTSLSLSSNEKQSLRQCRVFFGNLTQHQMDALENFILRHVTIPQLQGKKDRTADSSQKSSFW
jgi:hypothetical protein